MYGRIVDSETEETVWSAIEGPSAKSTGDTEEDPLWSNIEGAQGNSNIEQFFSYFALINSYNCIIQILAFWLNRRCHVNYDSG